MRHPYAVYMHGGLIGCYQTFQEALPVYQALIPAGRELVNLDRYDVDRDGGRWVVNDGLTEEEREQARG